MALLPVNEASLRISGRDEFIFFISAIMSALACCRNLFFLDGAGQITYP